MSFRRYYPYQETSQRLGSKLLNDSNLCRGSLQGIFQLYLYKESFNVSEYQAETLSKQKYKLYLEFLKPSLYIRNSKVYRFVHCIVKPTPLIVYQLYKHF
jgi:hypothetical protein